MDEVADDHLHDAVTGMFDTTIAYDMILILRNFIIVLMETLVYYS